MSSGSNNEMTLLEDKRADLSVWKTITVGPDGGIAADDLAKVRQIAVVMCNSGTAVPSHLRGPERLGTCISIATIAARFGFDPFLLASKSYVVNDKLAFESQVIHAIIEQSGFMSRRLRHRYIGEGEALQCEITGWLKGEDEPFVFLSPKIKDITVKNSPLWKSKPALQLFYNATRDWARMYLPEVVMGLYSNDELEDAAPKAAYVAAPRTAREAMERATIVTQAGAGSYYTPKAVAEVAVGSGGIVPNAVKAAATAAPVSPAYAAWRAGLLATTTPDEAEAYQIPVTLTEAEFDMAADEKAQLARSRRG